MADSGKIGGSSSSSSSSIHGEKREEEEEKEEQLQTTAVDVEEDDLKLPHGHRFHPTKGELIVDYLTNKIFGRKLPSNIIKEFDLFHYDPHHLPISEFKYGRKGEAYYYTYTEQKYWHGIQQHERITPTGRWKSTVEDDEIIHDEKVIGFKKTFVFYEGKAPTETRTDWIMHEYSVNPRLIPMHKTRGCVICKIRYKDTRNMPSTEGATSPASDIEQTEEEFLEQM